MILSKISGYVKTFKDENDKLMSSHMDDDKLLEKYKTVLNKIENLKIKSIVLNALPTYYDSYIKTKTITDFDKRYTNFIL